MPRFAISSWISTVTLWINLGLVLLAAASGAIGQTTYTITTIAGDGTAGFIGDAGPAKVAEFDTPYSVYRDSAGNLYIADQNNNRIRKIDTSGNINTIAGDGTQFYLGDGGLATAASMIHPLSVATTAAGDVYIADTRNHAIRVITIADGKIKTIAGNGQPGYTGDAGTDTTVTYADATQSTLDKPVSIVFDKSGNLYISDSLNNVVRRITTDNLIRTYAGNGVPGYTGDGGAATSAEMNTPDGLAIDSAGNLFISDSQNHVIRKVDTNGNISTVAGNNQPGYSGDGGQATSAMLFYPKGIAVDGSGKLYIADMLNSRIRRVAEDGTITTIAGDGTYDYSGDGGPAEQAQLLFPTGVTVGPNGTIYVVDTQNHVIRLLTPNSTQPTVAPTISAGGVISASAFGAFTQAAAPGSWVEIYGSNFATTTFQWTPEMFVNGQAPTNVGGVSVSIGGQFAPISYVSPGQINAQVPTGVGLGSQPVIVTNAVGPSPSVSVNLVANQAGLLAPGSFKVGNVNYAAAIFPDGKTFDLPANNTAGVPSKIAKAGDTLTFYGVGFGPVTPAIVQGQIPNQLTTTQSKVRFFFGQVEATVSYSGLAPSLVGVYQFNVVVPFVTAGSAIPLSFTVDGQPGAQTNLSIVVN